MNTVLWIPQETVGCRQNISQRHEADQLFIFHDGNVMNTMLMHQSACFGQGRGRIERDEVRAHDGFNAEHSAVPSYLTPRNSVYP
jgi:hypothetical protein